MQVKVKAFPATYLNTWCSQHQCRVTARVEASKDFKSETTIGAQVTTLLCEVGGEPTVAPCTGSWEMTISAYGEVVISQ